jgi:plasmid stabilization system protein ParE
MIFRWQKNKLPRESLLNILILRNIYLNGLVYEGYLVLCCSGESYRNENSRYIAKENPDAARVVISAIYEAGNRIKESPDKTRIVPEIGKSHVKEIFCRSYRIIYKIEARRITILTVRHMRQHLKPE